jgi:Polyketide cyclase / dehydrase and lipid transport
MKRTCSAETVIDAPAEAIWAVVCDVTRVGEWSGECRGCSWVGAVSAPIPGARFRGANRRSWLRWTRLNEIITVNEPVQLNWRTIPSGPYPDSVEWQIDLARENGSTRVRESFTVLTMPRLMEWLLWAVVPAHRDRTHDLESDLKRLKSLAEHSRVTALFAVSAPPWGGTAHAVRCPG